MSFMRSLGRLTSAVTLILLSFTARAEAAPACVWKVTDQTGHTLYLGGSIHALRSTDYPLPQAYNRAFEASARLAFEVDQKGLFSAHNDLVKSSQYSRGDSLKNHVDPRTYDYMRRLFGLLKVPEEKFARYRPWFIAMNVHRSGATGFSSQLGVEGFLERRARANSKPVSGLESSREHSQVFAGLTDRQSETLLLLTLIPQEKGSEEGSRLLDAWHRGDADSIARMTHDSFKEFPSFGERIIDVRNRNWIPKIESYLRSNQTYFVVGGAAHMGGPSGVLALLRLQGYRVEQL
ncbi:MAG: TraB/GumN family protein [Chthoniobacterales bacterium]